MVGQQYIKSPAGAWKAEGSLHYCHFSTSKQFLIANFRNRRRIWRFTNLMIRRWTFRFGNLKNVNESLDLQIFRFEPNPESDSKISYDSNAKAASEYENFWKAYTKDFKRNGRRIATEKPVWKSSYIRDSPSSTPGPG